MKRINILLRRFGWSNLLRLAAGPNYLLIILPILATIADSLGYLGYELPLRTKLLAGGAIICGFSALLIRFFCPTTISITQSVSKLKDVRGMAGLKEEWKKDLRKYIDSVGLNDAARTIKYLVENPRFTKEPIQISDKATLSGLISAIDRADFLNINEVAESARNTFEHIYKKGQLVLTVILILGWLISGAGLALSIISIYSQRGVTMKWLEFSGTADRKGKHWHLIPDTDPEVSVLTDADDIKIDRSKIFVRQGSRAIEIFVPDISKTKTEPADDPEITCEAGKSRCIGRIEYCCDREARTECNGKWDFCD